VLLDLNERSLSPILYNRIQDHYLHEDPKR